ncbi:co-chaperone GroES [Candidatus Kaiserbacteria bacterium]|nr:co-chaperone GroES [Candidatus Kaiserbacteria bacterium]
MPKGSAKKPRISPLGDRVLIEIPPREQKTKSGIIIPDTVSQEKPEEGKVIAVGLGRVTEKGEVIPVRVKVNDRVVFSKYGYDEITVDEVKYYIVKEENILAVIK